MQQYVISTELSFEYASKLGDEPERVQELRIQAASLRRFVHVISNVSSLDDMRTLLVTEGAFGASELLNAQILQNAAERFQVVCGGCGLREGLGNLQWCAGCRTVKYCSTACQKKHWKTGHKRECTKKQSLLTT